MTLQLNWQSFNLETFDQALAKRFCLYAVRHAVDGDRPFYIGKAKFFGPSQVDRYMGSARYNAGYQHLLLGLFRSGFTLHIAEIGEERFHSAEKYEQDLIAQWNPVRNRRRSGERLAVRGERPWQIGDA